MPKQSFFLKVYCSDVIQPFVLGVEAKLSNYEREQMEAELFRQLHSAIAEASPRGTTLYIQANYVEDAPHSVNWHFKVIGEDGTTITFVEQNNN